MVRYLVAFIKLSRYEYYFFSTCGTLSGMVIASSSWCRGEWVDYIFAANLAPCVLNILQKGPPPIVHHENVDGSLMNVIFCYCLMSAKTFYYCFFI